MKTMFVTGGAGFIGSNYLNQFVPQYPDTQFINIDCLTYAGNLKNVTVADASNYQFEAIDITDLGTLETLFVRYAPTGVIHFAAESNVDKSIENPATFITTNVLGTHNLLYLSVKYNVARFHHISTDEVYGSLAIGDAAFTENHPLAANNPYSASKAGADLLVRSYHKTFGLDTVITRCSNNFGPNQDDTKLIPLFIKKLKAGESVPLYGDGSNVRDWLHVSDHVRAVDRVFNYGQSGEIYNVGGTAELSNLELVRILLVQTGRSEEAISYVVDRKGHDFRYAINAKKIESELGWKPEVTFASGIEALLRN
jgi:dTDP-glucose 4,6-dehydratase